MIININNINITHNLPSYTADTVKILGVNELRRVCCN